jgi:two-component system, NtrC family, sensor kinase
MTEAEQVDARLGEILEALLALARQDFQVRVDVRGSHDVLDAIAVGLNLLSEELAVEVASRRELERAHAELQAAEARLLHASKLAAVGQLASGVAHEINNPALGLEAALAIIDRTLGTVESELVARAPSLPSFASAPALERFASQLRAARAATEDASEAVARIRRLTGDLRTFARTDDERLVPLRLDDVVAASSRLAAPLLRQRAELELQLGGVPPVLGGRGRLGQLVMNLLVNAAQALPEGPPRAQRIRLCTLVSGEDVVLSVEDSGPGVPESLRARIFEPFFTTKPEGVGTGLGLSLVAEIVRAHSGSIRVEQSELGGARFEVRFPLCTEAVVESPSPPPLAALPRLRLLMIDDEPMIVRLFGMLLAETCDMVSAASGAKALELLEKDRDFAVILCDLHMPGVDGIEVYERVGELERKLLERFVFTTGGAVTARARQFLDRVKPRLLAKPFPPEELFELIRSVARGE